ncbi:GNAT family N-acetyltransferase [Planosporangium mesophilum]|uniref:N-acetyltransferase n=1 Tax=Planosporangium mesophilum TaxID=689768 RepID=A0A8J3TH09_9ACTN|nr:GNAT family N-acetyltransferase [Planosporangium mesophilum]NJC84335.1 GNAT family N-acetyltransferase [Planosporangium mesophilum]GII25607.1 N-acetyltransferase [Planosporangium mesophilum]
MAVTTIRRARPGEAKALAQVIADAFHDLAVCRWMVPDPAERRRVLPPDFQIFVEHGIEHGTVHTTDRLDAVAVWFSDAPEGVPDIPDYDARVAAACDPYTERFRLLDEAMHRAHPTGRSHEHLALLAVAPAGQGAGLGTALLDARHAYLDREGIPAYLEASSLRSRDLYLRNGYVDLGEPFAVPGGPDPAMWPLWRDPAQPAKRA